MKVAYYTKIQIQIFKDSDALIKIVSKCVSKLKTIKKGIKVLNIKIQSTMDGDDFIKNMYTLSIHGDAYKKPRFIK